MVCEKRVFVRKRVLYPFGNGIGVWRGGETDIGVLGVLPGLSSLYQGKSEI
jgi:hypothetical protein